MLYAYDSEKKILCSLLPPEGWAIPGGTAIPGQPVAKAGQAPDTSPSAKNQVNIEWLGEPCIRY